MLLSTRLLKAAGCLVSVQENGYTNETEYMIEIHFKEGQPLAAEVADEIEARVGPEYGPAVFEALAHKVEGIQLMQVIQANEGKAWRHRNSERNPKKGK
jgi:hypothetical protein